MGKKKLIIEKVINHCKQCVYCHGVSVHNQMDNDSWYYECRKKGRNLTKDGWHYGKIKIPQMILLEVEQREKE